MEIEIIKKIEGFPRVGTFLIAQGFQRKHNMVTRLIERYGSDFEEFGELQTEKVMTKGRPAIEFQLNFNQLLFLVSIMRGGGVMTKVKQRIISTTSLVNAMKLISSFDVDDITVRFVYAAQDEHGRIKIGISNDPERRLKELSAANGGELKLILVREAMGQGYSDEVKLHEDAGTFRIHSEWFTKKAEEVLG